MAEGIKIPKYTVGQCKMRAKDLYDMSIQRCLNGGGADLASDLAYELAQAYAYIEKTLHRKRGKQ